jgi:hypothetical protein
MDSFEGSSGSVAAELRRRDLGRSLTAGAYVVKTYERTSVGHGPRERGGANPEMAMNGGAPGGPEGRSPPVPAPDGERLEIPSPRDLLADSGVDDRAPGRGAYGCASQCRDGKA